MRELRRTYPFISVHDEGGYYSQSIDKDAAEKAGISKRTVLLAYEMIDFQNRLGFEAYRSEILGIPMAEVELREFPKVEEFFEEATKKAEEKETEERRIDGLSIQIGPFRIGGAGVAHAVGHYDDHACGSFRNHIPDVDPPESWVPHQDPRNALLGAGFHLTSPNAACSGYNCSNDYTYSRSYTSEYGTCPHPFFRNHGHVDDPETGYAIQKGEPNPESAFTDPDTWPYYLWRAYVAWWHFRH